MITVRNPNECRARTAIATEAMEVGMVVRLIQSATKGDPVGCRKMVQADLADATAVLGIVDFIPDDSEAYDYVGNVASDAFTVNSGLHNTKSIPSGSLVVVWMDGPIIGFTADSVDASIDFATIREGAVIAFKETTASAALIGLYASGDTTLDNVQGLVYQHEGAEITVMLTKI